MRCVTDPLNLEEFDPTFLIYYLISQHAKHEDVLGEYEKIFHARVLLVAIDALRSGASQEHAKDAIVLLYILFKYKDINSKPKKKRGRPTKELPGNEKLQEFVRGAIEKLRPFGVKVSRFSSKIARISLQEEGRKNISKSEIEARAKLIRRLITELEKQQGMRIGLLADLLLRTKPTDI